VVVDNKLIRPLVLLEKQRLTPIMVAGVDFGERYVTVSRKGRNKQPLNSANAHRNHTKKNFKTIEDIHGSVATSIPRFSIKNLKRIYSVKDISPTANWIPSASSLACYSSRSLVSNLEKRFK